MLFFMRKLFAFLHCGRQNATFTTVKGHKHENVNGDRVGFSTAQIQRNKLRYHPHHLYTWHSTTVRFSRDFLLRTT